MKINQGLITLGLCAPVVFLAAGPAQAIPPVEDRYAHTSAFLNETYFKDNTQQQVFEIIADKRATLNRKCRALEDALAINKQLEDSALERVKRARRELRATLKAVREAPAVLARLKKRLKNAGENAPIGLIKRGIEVAENNIANGARRIRNAEQEVARQRQQLNELKATSAVQKSQLEICRGQLRIANASAPGPVTSRSNFGQTQITPTAYNRVEGLIAGGMPITLFAGLDYSGLDDNRNLIDRNGDILSFVFGGALQLSPRTTVGISGIVQNGTVTSTAMNSKLTGTLFGFSIFAQHLINDHFTISGGVGYRHGRHNVRLNLASAKFNTDALTASGLVTGNFQLGSLDFKPQVSIDVARVWNGNTVFTNTIAQNKLARTHARFSVGATISKDFVGSSGIFTPSLGVNGVYQHRSGFRFTTFTFQRAAEVGLGASFNAGITFKSFGGMTAAINGNFGLFKKVRTYGVNGTVAVPLN